jgi:hypothetical protein
MLQEIIEPAWLDAFEAVLGRCALQKGDTVAILAETQSRPVLPLLARLAAQRLGAQVFTLTLPSVVGRAGPPDPVDGRVGRDPADQAGGPCAGRQHAGGGLHRGRPDACPRAAGHPERRRPRHLHQQRTPRGAGAPDARRRHRGAREGPHQAPARDQGHDRLIPGGDESAHFARRRGGRRQLGFHHPPGHPHPLARRHCAGLPGGGQRERHAGAGRRRCEPDLQALRRIGRSR